MSVDTMSPIVPLCLPAELGASHSSKSRFGAFVALTKPRIAVMVLLTVAVGFVLGARGASHPSTMALALIGTGLVASGASAWNQVMERERDSRMRRTARRPLPAGLLQPVESAIFATVIGFAGVLVLLWGTTPLAALIALVTLLLYVLAYTPLKPITTLNTAVGAIPGALPPVIGWAAATGTVGIEAFALFLIVFLWQFPHFLAIAWVHREDYARGGHKMLPCVDPQGVHTARQSVAYALGLIPAGLLPTVVGVAGGVYFVGALLAGAYYLAAALRFWADVSDVTARRLMGASFLYLPAILFLLLLNPMPA